MKKKNWIEIISALFILLFVYTASSKFLDFYSFKVVLSRSPLIGSMSPILAWALPLIEIAIALFLFIPITRSIGLWASFLIMSIFTVYIGYMIYFTPDRPCNCGGVLRQMTWKQHLIFNVFFTLLAATGLYLNKRQNYGSGTPVTFTVTA